METALSGKYLDGLSSKPVEVRIQLYRDHIEIIDEEEIILESWKITDIKNIDFTGSKSVHLTYGSFPEKNLIIEGELAFDTIRALYPELNRDNIYFQLLKGNKFKIMIYGLVSLVGVLLLYLFVVAPWIAVKVVNIIPKNQEIVMGNKMFESISKFSSVDDEISASLNDFFNETGFKSEYPVELVFIDEPLVNAYAVPGGKIIVYDGLLKKMDDWKQLAGLMAHELAHVEKRHSLKSLSRSLSIYIAVSVITTDLSGASTVLIDNAFKLNELSHSRSFEKEADNTGFDFMIENGIDPIGMIELFEELEKEEKLIVNDKSKKILRYISTHPLTEDRIKSLKERIKGVDKSSFTENGQAIAIFKEIKKMADQ
ncbi:MAG: M48 family metallopeptidase [Deltaproteobacteria bacterium]